VLFKDDELVPLTFGLRFTVKDSAESSSEEGMEVEAKGNMYRRNGKKK